jgi:DNA-binding transcriptional regulator LsrR (DeoR family)
MKEGKRARADQYARRVNAAARLLDDGLEIVEATRVIARRYRLSERQARRYVEHAFDEGEMDIPQAKIVFTVKLPGDLIRRVRRLAAASGETVSATVAQALEEFLDKMRPGPRGG